MDLWGVIRRGENDGPVDAPVPQLGARRASEAGCLDRRRRNGRSTSSPRDCSSCIPATNKIKALRLDPLQSALLRASDAAPHDADGRRRAGPAHRVRECRRVAAGARRCAAFGTRGASGSRRLPRAHRRSVARRERLAGRRAPGSPAWRSRYGCSACCRSPQDLAERGVARVRAGVDRAGLRARSSPSTGCCAGLAPAAARLSAASRGPPGAWCTIDGVEARHPAARACSLSAGHRVAVPAGRCRTADAEFREADRGPNWASMPSTC